MNHQTIINPAWKIIPKLDINKKNVLQGMQKNGKFNKDDIKDYVQAISDDFRAENKQGNIGVAFHYSNSHWRRAYMSPFGHNVQLFEVYEEHNEITDDTITGFCIYIYKD